MASSFPLVIASTLFALLSLIAIVVSLSTSSWYLVQTDDVTTHIGTFQICSEIRNESDSKTCHRSDSQDFVVAGDPLAPSCRRSASEMSLRFGSLFGILIVAAVLCIVSIAFLIIATVKAFIAQWWKFRTEEQIAEEAHRHEEEEEQRKHEPASNPIETQPEDKQSAPTTIPTTTATDTVSKDTTVLVDIPTTTSTTLAADPSSSSNEVSEEKDNDDEESSDGGFDVEYNVMPTLEIVPLVVMTVVIFITIIAWAMYMSTVTSWLYCDNSPCAFLGQNDEITVCEASMGYGFAFAVFAWLSAIFSVFLLVLRWVMLKVFGVDMPEEDVEMGGDGDDSPHDMSPPDTLNNTRNSRTTTRSLNNTLNRTNNGEVSIFAAENNNQDIDEEDEDEQCGRVVMPSNDITSQGSRGSNPKKKKKGSFNNRGHYDPMMPHQVPEEEGDGGDNNSPDNHRAKRQGGGVKNKYPTHRIWKY